MNRLLIVSAMSAFATAAHAQQNASRLNDLLAGGWQVVSGQVMPSYDFTDTSGRRDPGPAISVFLVNKGGLAYCVRSVNQVYEFCDVLKQAGH